MRTYKKSSLKELYYKHVIINKDGCWGWNGALKNGYGEIKFNGNTLRAHRANYIINYGEIPKNIWISTYCKNKSCSKLEHIYLKEINISLKVKFEKSVIKNDGGCWGWNGNHISK